MSSLLERIIPEGLHSQCTTVRWTRAGQGSPTHLISILGHHDTASCGAKTPTGRLRLEGAITIAFDPDRPIDCLNCLQFLRKHYPEVA